MNAFAATLCKQPVLGVLMWLSFMCGSNEAIRGAPNIDLSKQGEVLAQEIYIPMDEGYRFSIQFQFDSWAAYNKPGLAGDSSMSNHPACNRQAEYDALPPATREKLGIELRIQIDINSLEGKPVTSRMFTSRCVTSWGDKSKSRLDTNAPLQLKKGEYKLSVKNLSPIHTPSDVRIKPLLHGVGVGFP